MKRTVAQSLAALLVLALALPLALTSCRMPTDIAPALSLASGSGGDGGSGGAGGDGDTSTVDPPPPGPTGVRADLSGDSLAYAGASASVVVFAQNLDAMPASLTYSVTGPTGWSGLPANGTLAVAANASASKSLTVGVPAGAATGLQMLHYDIRKDGTSIASGDFGVYVTVH